MNQVFPRHRLSRPAVCAHRSSNISIPRTQSPWNISNAVDSARGGCGILAEPILSGCSRLKKSRRRWRGGYFHPVPSTAGVPGVFGNVCGRGGATGGAYDDEIGGVGGRCREPARSTGSDLSPDSG